MLGVLATALKLRCVIRSRELILFSDTTSAVMNGEEELQTCQIEVRLPRDRVVYLGAVVRGLKHDRGVTELLNKTIPTLDG